MLSHKDNFDEDKFESQVARYVEYADSDGDWQIDSDEFVKLLVEFIKTNDLEPLTFSNNSR